MITVFFSALSGLIIVVLSVIVIVMRNKFKVALGDNPQTDLQKYIRGHANFIEYTPLFLIIFGLLEGALDAEYKNILVILGSIFLIARISHAYGLMFAEKIVNNQPTNLKYRIFGMMGTFGCLIVASILLLWLSC